MKAGQKINVFIRLNAREEKLLSVKLDCEVWDCVEFRFLSEHGPKHRDICMRVIQFRDNYIMTVSISYFIYTYCMEIRHNLLNCWCYRIVVCVLPTPLLL